MSGTMSEQNHCYKTDFETRREDQDFMRQNISMIRPSLDSTPFGMNRTNGTTSPIDSIPIGGGMTYPTPLTRPTYPPAQPTDSSKQEGKAHVPADLESDPSLSDSSSSKSDSSDDINFSKSRSKN